MEYALYPVDEGGDPYVAHPTRLGNIIEAFETYPKIKYGLDAVFYWSRIWVALDKDLRDEIDTAQAVVDSSVYISYALYLSGAVMLFYAGIGFAHNINWLSTVLLPYVPKPSSLSILGVACFIIGYFVYRISLPVHERFGELFKSIFDQYRSKLQFVDQVMKEIDIVVGTPSLSPTTEREKNQIVWRYLRWHRIREKGGKENLSVREWKERHREAAPSPSSS